MTFPNHSFCHLPGLRHFQTLTREGQRNKHGEAVVLFRRFKGAVVHPQNALAGVQPDVGALLPIPELEMPLESVRRICPASLS